MSYSALSFQLYKYELEIRQATVENIVMFYALKLKTKFLADIYKDKNW